MANHKSSVKRARQTIKKRFVNKRKMTRVKTLMKKTKIAIAEGNKKTATELLPQIQSLLDKAAKCPVLKTETASRLTGRLAKQIGKLA